MRVTSKKIRELLNGVWPDLEYVWLWDNTYWMPDSGIVRPLLDRSNIPKMEFIDLFNDCDNFALQFLAECRRKRYFQWTGGNLPEDERYPVSIAFAFGDRFGGEEKKHALNMAVCSDEKIYMIDSTPGENRIWLADSEKDNVIFVFM